MLAQSFLVVIVSFVLAVLFLLRRKPKGYPPGPSGYPVVGNFFQLGLERHKTFIEWGSKYGDIIGLHLGPNRVVVLNNYRHIKEAFNESVFSGRPIGRSLKERNLGGVRGIIFNEGQSWVEQRRFCLRNLRDFGFGKQSMEVLVMEEVNELISNLSLTVGSPISTQNRFNAAVLNALWSLVCGKRYSHDDEILMDLLKRLTQLIAAPTLLGTLSQFFPSVHLLRRSFPSLFYNPGKEFNEKTYAFLRDIVKDHKETFQAGSPRDFIDVYLDQIERTGDDDTSSFYKNEGEFTPRFNVGSVCGGGRDDEVITRLKKEICKFTTLTWAFLLLALYPDVQEKLYEEIEKKIGNSRRVSLNDRSILPYLESTIMEVARFSSLVPMGVSHRTLEDTKFHGFIIPKDTIVMGNLYAASRDKCWNDPENFRPDRFIVEDASGKLSVSRQHDALIPFSVGKRVCPGEVLAIQELVLFMGNLVQRFVISTVPGEKPTLETISSGVLMPKAHKLILTDRFAQT